MGAMLARGARVFAVDPHEPYLDDPDGSLAEFLANLQRLNLTAVVTSVVERSETAAAAFDEAIDVLFIDGDHSEEGVLADFAMWHPKVKDGGKVAFHDVRNLRSPGVSKALSRVLWSSTHVANVRLVDSVVWLTRVDAAPLTERMRNRALAVVLRLYSMLARLPKPFVAMGRRLLAPLSTESGR
jgi:methyltransferase family protein